METEKDFLSYLPYLIQDMWAMGSAVEHILDMLGSLHVESTQANLLDLGCGKGVVPVRAAETYGYRVTGVDAMPEFLEVAQTKAKESNVSHLCTFILQDIRSYVRDKHFFDFVVLASLGGVFGSNANTVSAMRTQISSGGYIIIDDGYLKDKELLSRKGYGHYQNYNDTVQSLTKFNDQIVAEISTSEVSKQINTEYLTVIEKRGAELILQHPELKIKIEKYIDLQREECNVLDQELEGIIWVIKKN
jgi:SAM-dependent methyltransferase